jgi:amidohydrolase
VLNRFEHLVEGIAQSFGCSTEIELKSITPAVINNSGIATEVFNSAFSIFPEKEIHQDYRTMGSEDMAYMMQEIPGCYFFIGSSNPEMGLNFPHHHPRFDIDEEALPIAAAVMVGSILDILKSRNVIHNFEY